jgi:hypothetical protein
MRRLIDIFLWFIGIPRKAYYYVDIKRKVKDFRRKGRFKRSAQKRKKIMKMHG